MAIMGAKIYKRWAFWTTRTAKHGASPRLWVIPSWTVAPSYTSCNLNNVVFPLRVRNWLGSFLGWGLCYMLLNYFPTIQKICSGLVVSVVCWFFWVHLSFRFFFLLNWRDFHFHEHFQLEISSKCDLKVENSYTLCKFHKRRKGLRVRPMGSNADLDSILRSFVLLKPPFFILWQRKIGESRNSHPKGTLRIGVRAKEGKRGGGSLTRTSYPPLWEIQHGASRLAPFVRPKKTPTQQARECCCRISPRPSIGLFFSLRRLSAKKKQVVSKEKVVP